MLLLLAVLALQDTDTTMAVQAGSRLSLSNFDGGVTVTSWNRNSIRVQARHDDDTRVDVSVHGSTVNVRGRSRYGPPEVEYRLTVPADMSLEINTHSGDIRVEGVRGEIQLQTVEGGLLVKGGAGRVALASVEGDINLSGASGRINISSVDGGVRVEDSSGDLQVSAIDGEVRLEGIDASTVEVSTVDGSITFTGVIRDGGRYHLNSHDGDVTVTAPEIDAAVSVSTFDGEFVSDFPVTLTGQTSRRRLDFTLGRGRARLELESFDGTVALRRGSGSRRN